jgi:hypothetical protein
MGNANKGLARKLKEKVYLEDLGVDRRINVKLNLNTVG